MRCPTCGAPSPPQADWDQFNLTFALGVACLALTRPDIRRWIQTHAQHRGINEHSMVAFGESLREWLEPFANDHDGSMT